MAWVSNGFRYDCQKCGLRIGGLTQPLDNLSCQCGGTLHLVRCGHPVVKKLAGNMTCRKCHAIVAWRPDKEVNVSMTKCKDCGHAISRAAEACPNCGAKIRRTHWLTWLVVGLLGIGVLGAIVGGGTAPPAGPVACPPMDRTFLVLPDAKAYATLNFLDKASRLHASGQCVVDAGWSAERGDYYYWVKRPGEQDKQARQLRFTEPDLAK